MVYCPNCGNKISSNAKFCNSCGEEIDSTSSKEIYKKFADNKIIKGENVKMKKNRKFIIIVIVGILLAIIIFSFVDNLSKKPITAGKVVANNQQTQQPKSYCGDNICSLSELNAGSCPGDCSVKNQQTQKPASQQQASPQSYGNCQDMCRAYATQQHPNIQIRNLESSKSSVEGCCSCIFYYVDSDNVLRYDGGEAICPNQ
jgi:hypothetical protein